MLHSGIDLHKRTMAIHTVGAAGAVVRKADLPTNRAAVSAYFAPRAGPHQAVCECTSMWYWVRDIFVPQGIDLCLAHAKYLKAISHAKVNTDAVDAATMAQLLRVQLISKANMIAFHHAAIRAIQYFPEVKAEFQRWQRRKGKPIARAHRERTRHDRVCDAVER